MSRSRVAQSGPRARARRVVSERDVGEYSRTFHVHEQIEVERMSAEMRDGVLVLRLPKGEYAKVRKIEVKAS